MRRDLDSYKHEIVARLPKGPIWPSHPYSESDWDALFTALAFEPTRIDEDATAWLEDFFPDGCTQQLDRWEFILGLSPYDTLGALLGDDQRRSRIIARLRSVNIAPTLENLSAVADAYSSGSYVDERQQPFFQCGVAQMGQPNAAMGGNYGWQATLWVYSTGSYDPLFERLMRDIAHAEWSLIFAYNVAPLNQIYDGDNPIYDGANPVMDSSS